MFKYLYLTFIVSVIFGHSIYIGPATLRQYSAVIMSIYCLINWNHLILYFDKYIRLYILFIIFYGLSCLSEGTFAAFLKEVVAYYSVALVAYFASIFFGAKYNNYKIFVYTVLTCGFFNGLITILQYFGNKLAMAMGLLFVNQDNEQSMSVFSHMADGDSNRTILGLLGNSILNGYLSMLMPLLVVAFLFNPSTENKPFKRIIYYSLLAFYFVALFCVQERSGLLFALFLVIYVLYKKLKRSQLFFLAIFGLVIVIPLILYSGILEGSRFSEEQDESRLDIYIDSVFYIIQNPIFGGLKGAVAYIGNMPHNFILNAFIYSGFIGGISVLYVIFKQTKVAFHLIKRNILIGISLAFIGYTMNGLLHNPSIITGDVILWCLWGLIIQQYRQLTLRKR